MTELINITERNGRQVVSARELYEFLGFNKTQWARWSKSNVSDNPFAVENEDWVGVRHNVEGNETMDYAISIDFAKRLSMMARTEKGEQARKYFIECERRLKEGVKELSRKEILLLALEAEERAEKAQKLLDEAKPKIQFYDEVTESKDVLDFAAVAKVINKKGFGRNNLFEFLRNKGVLMNNNQPYQYYVDKGWFKVVESRWNDKNGMTKINIKTVVFQKGVEGIINLLNKNDN